jgi:hypothetical protein
MQGKTEAMLVIASLPHGNEELAAQVKVLGATVRYRDDDVDYLRIKIAIERVEEISSLRGVQALALDGSLFYKTSLTNNSLTSTVQQVDVQNKAAPPDRNTPAENPYLPTRDIGAPQFIAKHPTFDGRGVTIANFDGMVPDMLSPELQTATTLDGKPTRKIIDVINPLDPIDDDIAPKVRMVDTVKAHDGQFTYKGNTYLSPADGTYRIGFFNTATAFSSGLLKKYLRSSNPGSNSDLLAVLWDEQMNNVWVDTNQNFSFADEKAMTDYNVHYDLGIIGKDDPATPLRETIAFFVLTDGQNKFIHLVPLVYGHATGTTSVAAGRSFFGGRMNGVAPGAQIVPMLVDYLNHVLIEGMILAVRNPKVDLVTVQIASFERLNDGSDTLSVIYDRLVDRFKKPIFIAAGNDIPNINTVFSNSSGRNLISVGGYVNKATWLSNYAVKADKDDYLLHMAARGPRKDGGFKPDVVAPAAGVAAEFETYGSPGQPFTLPPGYSVTAGTSFATPMASGAAALLISAAKQTGIPYDAERLRWALKSTARYLPEYGAYEQGAGLINIVAAWEALQKAAAPVAISSRAQVNAVMSQYLQEPYQGPGIYEREGWKPSQTGSRTVTFRRTSGARTPITYAVRWTGNDGTFTSSAKITLPLNTPVTLPVTITPKTAGVHSAVLNLDEINGAPVVYQMMNTIVAAEQFTAENSFSITREGQAEYPGNTSYFFNVPRDASAFRVDTQIANGNLRLNFASPSGKDYDSAYNVPAGRHASYQMGGTLSRTIVNPEAGVWQVLVENDDLTISGERFSSVLKAKFTLTASVLGISAEPALLEIGWSQTDARYATNIGFTNNLGAFTGALTNTPLGSAFSVTPALTEGGRPRIYEIDVPSGATSLSARIGGASDKNADLDLYLYYCAGKECELKALSVNTGAEEKVTVAEPSAGTWKVVIDPVSIPTAQTTVDYLDIFTHPAFGWAQSAETPTFHDLGALWTSKVNVLVQAIPMGNRRLMGAVNLTSAAWCTVDYKWNAESKKAEAVTRSAPLRTAIIEMKIPTMRVSR